MTTTTTRSSDPRRTGPEAPGLAERPGRVLAVLVLAAICFALSQTVVIPALPTLGADYDASVSATSWVVTGFLLSASISTPIIGKLGDLYGKGRVLTVVLVLFAVGGAINALAPSIGFVIAGRMVQGVAAGVFPLAFGIIRDTFPRERIPGAISIVSSVFGIGAGIGLPLSGAIVDNVDVSFLFWISLIALPAALAAHRIVPPSPTREHVQIDWAGALLLSGALAGLLLGVTQGQAWGWGSPGNIGLLLLGAVLLAAWLRVEGRAPAPLIELRVLTRPAVAWTNLTGTLVGLAMFSGYLLVPQLAQAPESTGYGFGYSVLASGLLLVPSAVGQLVAGPLAGRIGARVGFRAVLVTGAALCAASFLMLSLAHDAPWEVAVAGFLLGAGIAAAFSAMANLVVAAVPQSDVGIATGINTVCRTVGGAFGAALTAALLASTVTDGFATERGYTLAFGFSALMAVLATVTALFVPRPGARVEEPAEIAARG